MKARAFLIGWLTDMNKQSYRLTSAAVMMNASGMLHNLPVDGSVEVIFRDYKKASTQEQRKLMFGIRLAEIAEQAWVNGRQFDVATWHEFFKVQFLPEVFMEGETLDGYAKWKEMPNGRMAMVGSTTRLTTRGQCNYATRIESYAAQELGVQFSSDQSFA